MFYAEASKIVVAEAVSLPRRPILCRRGDQNAADESKIFLRRIQGFRRRVQNISPTRPKYFADASKYFADASRDFTADMVTLPTLPFIVIAAYLSLVLKVVQLCYFNFFRKYSHTKGLTTNMSNWFRNKINNLFFY